MSNRGLVRKANWAALLILAAYPAAADDFLPPAAGAASGAFELRKETAPNSGFDRRPTRALNPVPAAPSFRVSRDLSLPSDFLHGLPPEAPPASFAQPDIVPVGRVTTSPTVEDLAALLAAAEVLTDEIHAALGPLGDGHSARAPFGPGVWASAQKAIAAVYAERGYAPLWLDGDHWSSSAKSALAQLAKAEEDGIDLAATPTPLSDWGDSSPRAQAHADLQLSVAVVAYAMQASGARINPRALSKDVSAKPDSVDPGTALKSVAIAADQKSLLAAFNPPQDGYRALRAALSDLRAQMTAPVARFAPGPVLNLGMSDPRVALVRSRLGLGAPGDAEQVYDIRVASAVAAFQRVHGLPPNGSLTKATAAVLDGAGDRNALRERLILANMEMWRWEPRDFGATRVEVNVPDFSLTLTQRGAVIQKTRVIVGKPDSPTPIFSNSIKYMLFNPVWRVPESIVNKEMAPKYAADPSYFERHGYKVSYVGDKLEIAQPPGEGNALGRMLFLFPNEHAVYLHDTPQKTLFSSNYRALSHGCVRVEDPARLAVALMGGANRGWTETKVRALIGDKERTFGLPFAVPVHLEYFTEFVDGSGKLREREDLYGLTGKVESALASLQRY